AARWGGASPGILAPTKARPRAPPDITAGAELPCQLTAQNSGSGGAVLERGGIVVKLDELRERAPNVLQQCRHSCCAVRSEVARDAARHHGVHHQAMPKA